MGRSRLSKICISAIAIVCVSALPTSSAWAANGSHVTTASSEVPAGSTLIGSVTGDSLADVLTRSEKLNAVGELDAFIDNLSAEAEAGRVVSALGLEDETPATAATLLADAQTSLLEGSAFSEEVENFVVVPESVVSPDGEIVEDTPDASFGARSAAAPTTPADYTVFGEAFHSNHSWQWVNEFKIEECELFCEVIDRLKITTTIDPGELKSRVTHNQLYFPKQLSYFNTPQIVGKIYLPTAPHAASRTYTLPKEKGEFIYNHKGTNGKKFVMGIVTSVPTDGGDTWAVKNRTKTATCGTNIDGFCQWWL